MRELILQDIIGKRDDARTILDAIVFLQSLGHDVGLTGDVPGLFHIDDQEVTANQLVDIATQEASKR